MLLLEDATAVVASFWHDLLSSLHLCLPLYWQAPGLSLLYAVSTGLAHQDI